MAKNKKKSKEFDVKSPFTSFYFGGVGVSKKGRMNRGRITQADLRALSRSNDLVRICISKIRNAVCRTPWIVRATDEENAVTYAPQVDYINNLLKHPNSSDDSMRSLISKIVEDVLVIDSGVVEKVKNLKGEIVEIYQVDGATIRPNIDEYGVYAEPAYYQYVDPGSQIPDAEFDINDLLVFRVFPNGESGKIGYGYSPVESIAMTVISSLNAMIYNSKYFDDSKLPPFLFNLAKVPAEELRAFKDAWEAQMSGKPWANVFTNAENMTAQPLRPSNVDMQFTQLNDWLTKVILSAFELNPIDMGMSESTSRSNSQTQERLTKNQGIASILDVIAQEINDDLIGDMAKIDPAFENVEFAWDNQDKIDDLTQAQVDQIYLVNGVLSPNDVRTRDGMNGREGGDEYANILGSTGDPYAMNGTDGDPVDASAAKETLPNDQTAQEEVKTVAKSKFTQIQDKWLKMYLC